MISAGAIVWISVRPLIRLFLNVGAGFVLTRADLFPTIAARGAGQIILNIALPCLMFSRIVPAFTSQNIHNLGPLVLVAFIYEALGIVMAWLISQFFWVPHRFRYGILVAGGWGNVGDIPTSVIMSITASAPFNGAEDQNLAVAYIAAFILVFFITLFPLGGHRLIAKDYVGPDVEADDVRAQMRRKRRRMLALLAAPLRRRGRGPLDVEAADEAEAEIEREKEKEKEREKEKAGGEPFADTTSVHRHVAFTGEDTTRESSPANPPSTPADPNPDSDNCRSKHVSFHPDDTTVAPTDPVGPSVPVSPAPTITPPDADTGAAATPTPAKPRRSALRTLHTILTELLNPCSLAILIAFPIALVRPLKALFVPIDNSPIPNAPDGQPPLAFILDTATFIGAASVPLGLVTLGSALARLKGGAAWRAGPRGAIMALALGKMVLSPVVGVCIVRALVRAGVIDGGDRVLQFVCIFLACLPTATTQVYLTQVYSGTGTAEHLSVFLIPQYIMMFITMTALTAYTLQLLF
ncbi:auxin efflux carrier [Dentipellis sp. KUC8613]|nr:auxin efflux carrier [Dentipellis sp. KUC8613]